MSLATRCSACGIVFRVVEDQLKVAEGWVRCGRCSQVFDAVEGLIELAPRPDEKAGSPSNSAAEPAPEAAMELAPRVAAEVGRSTDVPATADVPRTAESADLVRSHESLETLDELESRFAPAEAEDAAETGEIVNQAAPVPAAPPAVEPTQLDEVALGESIDDHFFKSRRGPGRSASTAHLSERDRLDFSDARFDSKFMDDDESSAEQRAATPHSDAEAPLEAALAPEFVRHAESRARWRQPKVRTALSAVAVLSVMALVMQAGHQFRDLAAAQWSWTRPLLSEWCAAAGCTIEAPRRIDDISVESTSLAKVAGSDAFRLAVTLHNRSEFAVAVPWIDLKLSNTSGKLVARKALGGKVFKPAAAALQPGAEIVLQTLLATRDVEVAGYTVEIFYP